MFAVGFLVAIAGLVVLTLAIILPSGRGPITTAKLGVVLLFVGAVIAVVGYFFVD